MTCVTVEQIAETTRRAVSGLVEEQERKTRSRMMAYERVARDIGMSESWVRKLLGRSPDVSSLSVATWQAIRSRYETLCERIEADNKARIAAAQILKGQLDAVIDGHHSKPSGALPDVED